MSYAINNPPAFPVPAGCGNDDPWNGMSLRDYFAAQAMQGFIANPTTATAGAKTIQLLGEACYKVADLMLAERVKGTQ